MTVATFVQPNRASDSGSAYPANIDAAIAVLATIGRNFAPRQTTTPAMTVTLDAGRILTGPYLLTVTEVAAQTTGTITAPVGNPRIDRIVIDSVTGAVSVITGTPAASPAVPALTLGKLPIAQVLLQTSSTTITNSMITDERHLIKSGSLGTEGGSLVFLGEAVASDSSSINFTSLSSNYDDYVLHMQDVVCVSSPIALWLRYSTDGGSSYKSGGSDYLSNGDTMAGGSAQIALTTSAVYGSGETASGAVWFFNMNSTNTRHHKVVSSIAHVDNATSGLSQAALAGSSHANMAAAINAIRVLAAGGNITSGTFRFYGIKKQ